MVLESIRQELVKLNQELPKNNLVTWTSGKETGYVTIKPSGVMFEIGGEEIGKEVVRCIGSSPLMNKGNKNGG